MSRIIYFLLVLHLAAFRETMAQSFPSTSPSDQEQQRIERERQQMFGPNSTVPNVKKDRMPRGDHLCHVPDGRGTYGG